MIGFDVLEPDALSTAGRGSPRWPSRANPNANDIADLDAYVADGFKEMDEFLASASLALVA